MTPDHATPDHATPDRSAAVARATTEGDLDDVRRLFRAYAESLDFDLCFQGFEAELADLPGPYAPPHGTLLLARETATTGSKDAGRPAAAAAAAVGCVAVRPLGDVPPGQPGAACEMKRLYVHPTWRGEGLGRRLAAEAVEAGRRLGYAVMRLDTVRTMHAARAIYAALGFREIDAYYPNPLPDVVYLERRLDD